MSTYVFQYVFPACLMGDVDGKGWPNCTTLAPSTLKPMMTLMAMTFWGPENPSTRYLKSEYDTFVILARANSEFIAAAVPFRRTFFSAASFCGDDSFGSRDVVGGGLFVTGSFFLGPALPPPRRTKNRMTTATSTAMMHELLLRAKIMRFDMMSCRCHLVGAQKKRLDPGTTAAWQCDSP